MIRKVMRAIRKELGWIQRRAAKWCVIHDGGHTHLATRRAIRRAFAGSTVLIVKTNRQTCEHRFPGDWIFS